jgi:DNA polymerase phi
MSGQEERDVLFARLFGTMSVIQSGLAVRTAPLPTSASSAALPSTLQSYEHIIVQLLDLGNQKSWLRESAWFVISLAVDALHESDISWKENAVEKTLQHLFIENKIWSTEKIALALKLQDLYPGRDWKTLLSPTFKMSDLFGKGNLMIIARILKVCLYHCIHCPFSYHIPSRNRQQMRMDLKTLLKHQAGRGDHS